MSVNFTAPKDVIVCHNHPSWDFIPSVDDINITRKIREGLKLLDVNLIEALIITPNKKYFSFVEHGLIS